MTSGYSGTPLSKKLGIKEGARVGTFGGPDGLGSLLEPLPAGVEIRAEPTDVADVLIVFATSSVELEDRFGAALHLLPAAGGLWVGWPKKSSGIETDLGFDAVQTHGLAAGLVDNKVCAIDETWSGLRFVVRTADRADWPR